MSSFKDPVLIKKLKEALKQTKPKIRTKKNFSDDVKNGNNMKPKNDWEKMYKLCFAFKKSLRSFTYIKRITELKKLGRICISKRNVTTRNKRYPRTDRICEVCDTNESFYRHHLILLKNGGYDEPINRIWICDKCHSLIHPWLKVKDLETKMKEEMNQFIDLPNT